MSELRTPEDMLAENEIICEKLLKWERDVLAYLHVPAEWKVNGRHRATPTFATWAEAGLILDALYSEGTDITFATAPNSWWCEINEGPQASDKTGPLAVRAAALQYIRSLP